MKVTNQKNIQKGKSDRLGFTIVEVMLVVAIAGAMLIGLISGTFITIAQQRYNDALRSFAEYLRTMYSHAQSPESLGFGNSGQSILGKLVVFGYGGVNDKVYSATIVGDAGLRITGSNFLDELKQANARLFCGARENPLTGIKERPSTVEEYTLLWQAKLTPIDVTGDTTPFQGALIITRTPTSGAIHTAFTDNADIVNRYNLVDNCTFDSQGASENFKEDIQSGGTFQHTSPIEICVKSDDNAIAREVRIEPDARNTSGISLIQADSTENKCKK